MYTARPFLASLLWVWAAAVVGQDSSLTREFAGLSAKERTRIAQREEREAAVDSGFQVVMAKAEGLFRQQRYEEALAGYIEARERRPLNVYPKVKIQDLRALLAMRDAAAAGEKHPAPEEDPRPPPGPSLPAVEGPAISVPATVPERDAEPAPPLPKPVPKRVVDAHPREVAPRREVQVDPRREEGPYERIYREGRAVVVERQVVADGRPVVYRKVAHPWGEVVHFKDGLPIPERAWAEVFGDR